MLSVTCKPYLSCPPREKKTKKPYPTDPCLSASCKPEGICQWSSPRCPPAASSLFQGSASHGRTVCQRKAAMSGLVAVYRPETGAVGSQYFIPQYHVAVLIQSELQLGICDNDSFGQCIIRTFFINSDGIVTKLGRIFCALAGETLLQIFHTLLIGDILIMISDLRLGGRGIDGLGKLICLLQTFRKLDTAYGTVFFL